MRKLVALVVLAGAVAVWASAAQARGPNPPGLQKILGTVPTNPHAAAAVRGSATAEWAARRLYAIANAMYSAAAMKVETPKNSPRPTDHGCW